MDEENKVVVRNVPKVYSPDVTPYSFEGRSYFFGTLVSFVVAPIRLLSRVMHNIFILPANLQEGYASALLLVSGVLMALGVLDLFIFHKWPLLVSQIPALLYAMRLRRHANLSQRAAADLRKVEIDEEAVEEAAGEIYDEFSKILEDDK